MGQILEAPSHKMLTFINKETGIPIVDIPGGHLGYIQKPEGFADVLLNMWG